ncbi:MAG: VanZ family protein [Parcubacteria group bacterium]|jgi:VanZ family protein
MKKNNKSDIFFNINLLLVVIWMGVIFYFSSLQGDGVKYNPPLWFFIERKGAHIGEYFILVLFLIKFFIKRYSNLKDIFVISALVALLYAFTDEIHQLFVFGREGKITDVGFDFIGISLGIVIAWLFFKIKKRKLSSKL